MESAELGLSVAGAGGRGWSQLGPGSTHKPPWRPGLSAAAGAPECVRVKPRRPARECQDEAGTP